MERKFFLPLLIVFFSLCLFSCDNAPSYEVNVQGLGS